jgi:hypothetical protein
MDDVDLDGDDLTFRVDRIDLTDVEIRVTREDRQTWCWQVAYVGAIQFQGWTHDGELEAFRKAQAHRDLWLEQELEAIRRLPADDD